MKNEWERFFITGSVNDYLSAKDIEKKNEVRKKKEINLENKTMNEAKNSSIDISGGKNRIL